MAVALTVPSVGESINEVEVGEWLKHEGDFLKEGDPVVVIETEKATLEVPAPVSGKLTQILKKTGEKAAVGEVIGSMEAGAPPAMENKPSPTEAQKEPEVPPQPAPVQAPPPAQPPPQPVPAQAPPEPPTRPLPQEQVAPATEAPTVPSDRKETVVPMTPIRRRIAERLVEAQRNAALLTTFNEIDMSTIMSLRNAHKEAFEQKHGVKLGIVSFFVKALIRSLIETPQLNAEIRGEHIVYKDYYDIGIAIGAGKGLVVPVLRNAEHLGFAEIEKAISDFATRARENHLKVDELQGGTFTISNGGIYGSLLSTPMVNPPQSGVLGLHAIKDRPVAHEGQVVVRPMMYVALTYDHRIVDGREAVTFLKHVKDLIEEPALLLLDL